MNEYPKNIGTLIKKAPCNILQIYARRFDPKYRISRYYIVIKALATDWDSVQKTCGMFGITSLHTHIFNGMAGPSTDELVLEPSDSTIVALKPDCLKRLDFGGDDYACLFYPNNRTLKVLLNIEQFGRSGSSRSAQRSFVANYNLTQCKYYTTHAVNYLVPEARPWNPVILQIQGDRIIRSDEA